jgi:hypothetical protein
MLYIMGVFIAILTILYFVFKNKLTRVSNQYKYNIAHIKDQNKDLSKRLIREAIYLALCKMDETCGFYVSEDEANREMTTCLNLLGHHAEYQHRLDNNRSADVLVDNNTLIEGKLDPQLSDVDRLVGQLGDYACYPYNICVVIYGFISEPLLNRLRMTVAVQYPNICIIHMPDPNRVRRQNALEILGSS